MKKVIGVLVVAIAGVFCGASAVVFSGTATDSVSGKALANVRIMETTQACTTFTDTNGKFSLNVTTGVVNVPSTPRRLEMAWHADRGFLTLSGCSGPASVLVKNLQGSLVARFSTENNVVGSKFSIGKVPRGVYVAQVTVQGRTSVLKIFNLGSAGTSRFKMGLSEPTVQQRSLLKSSATGFSLRLDKPEYRASILSETGSQSNMQIKMKALAVPAGMKLIPAGKFQMGSTYGYIDEAPVHSVTISSAFYMDSTDVTQKKFNTLMGVNPASIPNDSCPVDQVNWYVAMSYCNKLSKQDGLDSVYSFTYLDIGLPFAESLVVDLQKNGYRLPTEAQWEYACRAGNTGNYFWGNDSSADTTSKYSWYSGNSNGSYHPVATKVPNKWGLYDMSGNVWQWCNDLYGRYADSAQTDPTGAAVDTTGATQYYVLRGGSYLYMYGSWHVDALRRSSARYGGDPGFWYSATCTAYGFRCVR